MSIREFPIQYVRSLCNFKISSTVIDDRTRQIEVKPKKYKSKREGDFSNKPGL